MLPCETWPPKYITHKHDEKMKYGNFWRHIFPIYSTARAPANEVRLFLPLFETAAAPSYCRERRTATSWGAHNRQCSAVQCVWWDSPTGRHVECKFSIARRHVLPTCVVHARSTHRSLPISAANADDKHGRKNSRRAAATTNVCINDPKTSSKTKSRQA